MYEWYVMHVKQHTVHLRTVYIELGLVSIMEMVY